MSTLLDPLDKAIHIIQLQTQKMDNVQIKLPNIDTSLSNFRTMLSLLITKLIKNRQIRDAPRISLSISGSRHQE
jgi:hypothetical protein